jgi:hypothetical protein
MVSFAQKLVVEREPQTAFEVALTRLDESWSILADLQIGPKDEIAAEYVVLHPAHGIALIDLASNTRNDPTDRLRRLLSNSQDFTFRFPGILPVVRLVAEATDAATIADRLEAAFAEAPAITIANRGWVNAASDILIGRVRGARLPARAMTERPEHLTQRHENTASGLDLDAWKYAPWRRRNDRPGRDAVEPEMSRHRASQARRPGGFIERPELSGGPPRRETVPGRRAIAPALQLPRSAFALLLGVIAGGMMGGGAVWLALSSGVGDRFEDAPGEVRVALQPPSLALPAPPVVANAPTPLAVTPSASITSPPAPATPTGTPPSVGPLPPQIIPANEFSAAITTLSEAPAVSGAQTAAERVPPAATVGPIASPAPSVEPTPAKDSPPMAAAMPTVPSVEAPAVSAPSAEPPTQPTALARLLDREPWQTQTATQYAPPHASPDEPELAQPPSTESSVSPAENPAENNDSPAAPPSAATLPLLGPSTLSDPPLATASPLASPPASSPPTMDKRPVAGPARLPAQPAPEKSAASAQRPMRMSEPRSKSTPTKQALLEARKPKRYDGPPIDADQLPPPEVAVNPPAPAIASNTPNMRPPTSLLSRPVVAHGLPVASCRAYTSTHNLLGQPGNARGVACREPDGQWTIIQETFN